MTAGWFDPDHYRAQLGDSPGSDAQLLDHYLQIGVQQYLDPSAAFSTSYYLQSNPDVRDSGINPLVHFLRFGRKEGRAPTIRAAASQLGLNVDDLDPAALEQLKLERHVVGAEFDSAHYRGQSPALRHVGPDLVLHYLLDGWKRGFDPCPGFSTRFYLEQNEDIRQAGVNPFFHYLTQGRQEGRRPMPDQPSGAGPAEPARGCDPHVVDTIRAVFDEAYYREQLDDDPGTDADLVLHYVLEGAQRGLNPNRDFSTQFYLRANPDVADAGVNPLFHFLTQGKAEGRKARAPARPRQRPQKRRDVYGQYGWCAAPGPDFEELDRSICAGRRVKAKALAYYLPQFHAIDENDDWWGTGFTEWRNTARGLPRFEGHYQPRIPRDLGFYSLLDLEVIRRQVDLAKAAGIHGFCFYYYNFNGERLLEKPLDLFLATPDIDMPFALIWANENWTKTWDGLDTEVLMAQDYREEDEGTLIADVARYMADPRYIRVKGRPIFIIYRPGIIPDCKDTVQRWRQRFAADHDLDPCILMAQGFNDLDPRVFGLDGAVEFPPHKVAATAADLNPTLDLLDPEFSGSVKDYTDVVACSLAEEPPEFPLIKGVTTGWDNEARRPGRGMVLHDASPEKYEQWLRGVVSFAEANPFHGEPIVVINAWNEWAEGAYLEPDVHFGSAYLNATARALTGSPGKAEARSERVLLVGHDAHLHGAQLLLKNIGTVLTRQFGIEVAFLIGGDGALLGDYAAIGETEVIDAADGDAVRAYARRFVGDGGRLALVNTTVGGKMVRDLAATGLRVLCLIHELPKLIREYGLEQTAGAIARHANAVVFPAEVVRDRFIEISGQPTGEVVVRPQGLYNSRVQPDKALRAELRARYGIPASAHVVINVGYADSRKGFDLFARAAELIASERDDVFFLWVGGATADIRSWLLPCVQAGQAGSRFILTEFVDDVEAYYAAADVFFLASREDPFPSVVLEAFRAGLPVVGFAGCGGCDDLIERYGTLVDRNRPIGAAEAIIAYLNMTKPKRRALSARVRGLVDEKFRFDDYCWSLLRELRPDLPRVSVVVPNYNYARHLEERLRSIFRQSHPVFEVIVLDDGSTDESLEVIERVAAAARRDIRLVVNEANSGSVFRQWRKGAELARGEYVWIAEADDTADERLLGALAAAMRQSNAAFGFCDSWQMDSTGAILGDTYRHYANTAKAGAFDRSFTMPGRDFLRDLLSVKNVILNVSSVLWRTDALRKAMDAVGEELYHFKVAGDWRLYAEACLAGGHLAYVGEPLNGHRRHSVSVTKALDNTKHFQEIVRMQDFVTQAVGGSEDGGAAQKRYRSEVAAYLGLDLQQVPTSATAAAGG